MFELNNLDSIQISLAGPEKIREWSYGEVTKPETINYRTQKPERDGLFCEKIFGPVKDWECHCGKYKRIKYKGVICDKCGVEVTKSKVRRERMGHIELAAPVSHIWYFRGVPSRMGLLLDMSPKALEQVLYFVSYVVIDPGETNLVYKQILSEKEKNDAIELFGPKSFKVGMGAEAIKELLAKIDLEKELAEIKETIKNAPGQKKKRAIRRLEIVNAFIKSGSNPTWMILDVLPVIPPEIRPMVQLDGGRFATSDLNDLYRRVINRNNRLKKLKELGAPDIIIRNEKRMLQEAVDALIDNGRRGKAVTGPGNRDLKSLSSMLRGKQGRFRQNLLGKRVDYSGRSVIVVGPELKIYQCGLPKEMALELFKPFVMKKLVDKHANYNIKTAKRTVERARSEVWDVLEEVIKDHPVLLNRAPTLHRLGIQAFEPVLVEGRAIKLHPLVCAAFNADFDGDQMAVHVPLSLEAQAEARFLMLSTNNILKLSDGKPVMTPTQDMVIGCYYLTIIKEGAKGEGRYFMDPNEAVMAYETKQIELQARIHVRIHKEIDGKKLSRMIETTVGRIIFNNAIPQDLGFVKRDSIDSLFELEVNFLVTKKGLQEIVYRTFKLKGATETAKVLDKIKDLGFRFSTIGAVTASIFDLYIPEKKKELIAEAEEAVIKKEKDYDRGIITAEEKSKQIIDIWNATTNKVTEELMKGLDEFNPIFMMANSGARGNKNQIRQLSGMRGLMTNPNGKIIETPVRSSFREGLSVLEYFISSHGGRKGLADTALKTADSGYLTRRLVDVSQDVIVREDDCFATLGEKPKGMTVREIEGIETLKDRIVGRFTIEAIKNPKDGKEIIGANELISEEAADKIIEAGIKEVNIRTVLTCRSKIGLCAKCYGKDMAGSEKVKIGEAVGIIAAQSIGEPGTQLTMRTFHTGGVASADDITQGLPRVEELFEARVPKGAAVMAEIGGKVTIIKSENKTEIIVKSPDGEQATHEIPYDAKIRQEIIDCAENGGTIQPGDPLTEGSINPNTLLRTKGVRGVQEYLLSEVQSVYRLQGVEINDKHIEIIIRQMLRKVRIETSGSTEFIPGELVDIFAFEEANRKALIEGGEPASAKRVLLGVTKAALATDSFLSAASFQETARVLTDAAIKKKVDPLIGLKENVIIGKLIPAGTGMKMYRNVLPEEKF
ncbi:MAG: DNA-directed RNA polymerase subunit beta' [Clostridiales bacterium]|nr:DNA-directed RNA polymerase subunit beta' [Clostridiales bacterium]